MSASASAATMMTHDTLGYAELCRPEALAYLEQHKLPQLFRSLVAALMVEQPDDHVAFIKRTLTRALDVGIPNLDWETFVYALHPKRSPQRLEYVRDGTNYEKQGLELMQQQQQPYRQPSRTAPTAASPPPPPLSPAPSLQDGGRGTGDLFRLTQGQWEDSTAQDDAAGNAQASRPRSGASNASSGGARQQLRASSTQEFVSDEVDKLLSEAIVMSIAARAGEDNPTSPDSAALVASLQAKLQLDAGSGDIWPQQPPQNLGEGGEDFASAGPGLFD